MSEHRATLSWEQGDAGFDYKTYRRKHTVRFENGATLVTSAAPQFLGDADAVDPESAFVGAVASCHMLTFLAFCSRKGLNVLRYEDAAVGFLERNAERKYAVTRIELRPRVEFAGETEPARDVLEALHHQAHDACFIANSITTEVRCVLD